MGHPEASLTLCAHEHLNKSGDFEASNNAWQVVAAIAAEEEDWRAITLQVGYLLKTHNRTAALALAKQLCRMTEPGKTTNGMQDGDLGSNQPLPWKTLFSTLHPSNAIDQQRAWKYGADVWDDPEACALHAQSMNVRVGSKYWLKYVTKGAMGGDVTSMRHLGNYYLAVHGWYPKKRKLWTSSDSKLGFDWLELSTIFDSPVSEANTWAGLALLMREHGDRPAGLKYLQKGRAQMDEKYPAADRNTGKAMETLDALMKSWHVQDLTFTDENRELLVASSWYLGTEIKPV
jgi:hypothetical protein